ncbi:unnamed protein product [Leptosia nina]|uniref:Uncharacterized protein n=1 Tax=Leptosia nina TaxID=320188 RepID=A0AAV1IXW0_9NEOP
MADQNTPSQQATTSPAVDQPQARVEETQATPVELKKDDEIAVDAEAPSQDDANGAGEPSEEWRQREQALELKVREEEIDLLRSRVKNLETELHAALSKPAGKNQEIIQNIKQQHEELLSKARGMIFDKTKMVKNQELQIEALNSQVQSLKDINVITKDLLNIRNSEVKAMEDRLAAMEARFKAEKERHALVLQRAQTSSGLNDDLKKEYETQLAIFKELREKYEQRVQALVSENQQLKDLRKMTAPS